MPRKPSGNFDQNAYVQQYIHDNIKHIKVSLNKSKPEDMQMIAWIAQQQEGASGYIKRLIREDMEGKPSATPIIERTVTPEGVLNLWQCGKCQTYIGTYLSKCPFCRTPIDWESVKHKLK